jgi:hypothetical protein
VLAGFAQPIVPNHRFTDIIFVDASSRENIEAALRSYAVARGLGNTHLDTLLWLTSYQGRWLLVFDNADNPDVRLHEYFPQSSESDILVTTRHSDLVLLAQGSHSNYRISGMKSDEAQQLLLKTARSNLAALPEEERAAAALLVQVISASHILK